MRPSPSRLRRTTRRGLSRGSEADSGTPRPEPSSSPPTLANTPPCSHPSVRACAICGRPGSTARPSGAARPWWPKCSSAPRARPARGTRSRRGPPSRGHHRCRGHRRGRGPQEGRRRGGGEDGVRIEGERVPEEPFKPVGWTLEEALASGIKPAQLDDAARKAWEAAPDGTTFYGLYDTRGGRRARRSPDRGGRRARARAGKTLCPQGLRLPHLAPRAPQDRRDSSSRGSHGAAERGREDAGRPADVTRCSAVAYGGG